MAWCELCDTLRRALGPDVAAKAEAALRRELGGLRLTVPAKRHYTPDEVHAAAPYRPRKAARILGIHPSSAYRLLRQRTR
jgi:hypothetical protein